MSSWNSVTLPIRIDDVDTLASGDICISYDRSVLKAIDVSSVLIYTGK